MSKNKAFKRNLYRRMMLFSEYLLQEKNNLKPIVDYNFKLNNISYNSNIVQSKVLRYKTLFTAHPITCCCLSSCVDFHKSTVITSQQCHHRLRDRFKQNDYILTVVLHFGL